MPALAGVIRRLERRAPQAPNLVEPAVKALDAALTALEETRGHLEAALRTADFDPAELERIEERLFALRAAARKYNVPVDELAALAAQIQIRHRADRCRRGAAQGAWKPRRAQAEAAYRAAADALSQGARARPRPPSTRRSTRELKPLKLERAKFSTEIASDAAAAGPERHRPRRILGADQSGHASPGR